MQKQESFIRPEQLWESLGLRAEQTVVHLGAGAGFHLIPAAKIVGPKGKAIGVDILPDMLSEIENRALREGVETIVQTKRANLENRKGSGLQDKIADWVLVINILHQSDPVKILKEAARIVAANGHVVVIEWSTKATPFGPPPEKRIPKEEVLQIAHEVGLQADKEFMPSPYHFGLLLKSVA